ncbi:hypothetical protein [uncultured Legionella sp.]|nr:hypothetical protein [uncultured Legionella sp.]
MNIKIINYLMGSVVSLLMLGTDTSQKKPAFRLNSLNTNQGMVN